MIHASLLHEGGRFSMEEGNAEGRQCLCQRGGLMHAGFW